MITSHDVGTVATYPIRSSFLDELGMKPTIIKVYEVELLMSCKLHCLSCHNEWSCHMFDVYDH